jgi:peptidoglycan/xylan/chitin deacetylase (PgdA/CDA1 family)
MTARALLATIFTLLTTIPLFAADAPRENAPAATVLCYHIVESPQDPRMEISRETFRQHMRYLAMTGYTVIPLRHLYEYVSGKRASIPKNAVVVTIDDGWRSTYTEVFPEMQKRKFPFTVFIYPKIIGQTAYAMSWKQVKEMSDAGVDIQSHSLSHPFLTQRRHSSFDERAYVTWLQHELAESKKILETQTGRTVSFLAYPYGDYDHKVADTAAKSGYSAALTCDFGRVRRGSDPLRMKRMVIDKKMDFASFRKYLGVSPMRVEETTPIPAQTFEPEQPVIISAKIPNHQSLDPKSIGMALITSTTSSSPFSYDARDGSISMVVHEAIDALRGKYQRALIWATDTKTGKRVEASWTFKIPDALLPDSTAPVMAPASLTPAPAPMAAPASTSATTRDSVTIAANGAQGVGTPVKHTPKK